jgi:outer membrane protein OmpA-like peptidoglycan-associated protein
MKKMILILSVLAGMGLTAAAQKTENHLAGNVRMARNGEYMAVTMDLDLKDIKVRNDRALVLTPVISNGDSLVSLQSVGIYSHNRWYYYQRNGETMITGADEISWKESQKPETVAYESVVPYKEWMNGSRLELICGEYGCCRKLIESTTSDALASYEEKAPYIPGFIYVRPQAEPRKTRFINGTAYIGFPVNETVIYPGFQDNLNELGKIRATIDSVRNDSDVTINAMSIKGFASPESPYANNQRLAKGRTQAVKKYVDDLYSFAPDFISVSSEPEDWEGLRSFVDASSLPNRKAILEIIDSDREPDNKEWKIKSEYKEDYRYMLDHFYPYLRHSDYVVEYTIRSYSDPAEIALIMKKRPQNLSLNEFHVYAQTLEPGSPEFIEVFETAVRMYPEDEIANLNAANTAMSRGDMNNALRYLDKAGNSLEAEYARGVYEFLHENYNAAKEIFEKVLEAGVEQAREPIEKINKYNKL